MKHIIDTNVPKMAANTSSGDPLDINCSLACLQFIKDLLQSDDYLVLDIDNEIYNEYRNNLKTHGQDNVATQFLLWVQRNLTLRSGSHIELCKIHKLGEGIYTEFPESPDLDGFDPPDRKFIALSNAHPEHPHVVEGTDSLWWGYKSALEAQGIHIKFLYEDYVRIKYEESHAT